MATTKTKKKKTVSTENIENFLSENKFVKYQDDPDVIYPSNFWTYSDWEYLIFVRVRISKVSNTIQVLCSNKAMDFTHSLNDPDQFFYNRINNALTDYLYAER